MKKFITELLDTEDICYTDFDSYYDIKIIPYNYEMYKFRLRLSTGNTIFQEVVTNSTKFVLVDEKHYTIILESKN